MTVGADELDHVEVSILSDFRHPFLSLLLVSALFLFFFQIRITCDHDTLESHTLVMVVDDVRVWDEKKED